MNLYSVNIRFNYKDDEGCHETIQILLIRALSIFNALDLIKVQYRIPKHPNETYEVLGINMVGENVDG